MQMTYLYILSGLASNVTPLTDSLEDIHIYETVCIRYVDDKKLAVFQSKCQGQKI